MVKQNKFRLFIENIFVYGIGGVISKLVPLIMVPIVTRLMPDTGDYGVSDLSNTVASFGSAIAGMGMYDAMFRMFFEKEDKKYKKDICSTALNYLFCTSIVVFVILILCKSLIARLVFGDIKYEYLVYITATTTLLHATNNIVSAPTRMQNKRKIFLATNTIAPIISYTVAILLIIKGHYIVALPIGAAVSALLMELSFYCINKEWFKLGFIDIKLLKQLLLIGVPLLPNFLIYWLFNSSDKLMIVSLMSTSASGIYSVGSKFGHVSQLIYTAFAGGWQYFAFSTMKEENQVKSNSLIFEYLGIISFTASLFVFPLSYPVFKILFTGDYVQGYVVSPYLFMAPLVQMLFQVAGNQFIVIKKTWPNMIILFGGAISNILLNYYLIPILGIEGAGIATLVGYTISVIVGVIVLRKMKLITLSLRFVISSALMVIYIVSWRILYKDSFVVSISISFVLAIINICLYSSELKMLANMIKNKGSKKNDNA